MTNFRCNATNFFVTWPKCGIALETIMDELTHRFEHIEYIIVAHELHEDGTPHRHALIMLKKRKDIRNERFLDIEGYHPSMESARNTVHSQTYCKKDGAFIEHGTFTANKHAEQLKQIMALTSIEDVREFIIINNIKHNQQLIIQQWESRHSQDQDIHATYALETFTPPGEVRRMLGNTEAWGRKALVIIGEPATGKSQFFQAWADHVKDCVWVSNTEDIKKCTKHTKFIIMNDSGVSHLPVDVVKVLLDSTLSRTIHARYRNARVPKGCKIILINNSIDMIFSTEQQLDSAIISRLHILNTSSQKFYEP